MARVDEILAQVAGDVAAVAEGGEDVDEAERLHLEPFVGRADAHHALFPPLRVEDGGLATLNPFEDFLADFSGTRFDGLRGDPAPQDAPQSIVLTAFSRS